MLNQLKSFLFKHLLFNKNQKVILTVSGGKDSMVLLHLFQQLDIEFVVAHCNFQLRGDESIRDMNFVADYCKSNNVVFYVKMFDTQNYALENKVSIQMAARTLRYNWFEQLRQQLNYDFIATAHHLNDQAETFLVNLVRGAGLTGLHGIPQKTESLIRPLLFSTSQMIDDYAHHHVVPHIIDSSNLSDKYQRNYIRHHIIPEFENQNPQFIQNLSSTIFHVSMAEEVVKIQTEKIFSENLLVYDDFIQVKLDKLKNNPHFSLYLYYFLLDYDFSYKVTKTICDNIVSSDNSAVFYSLSHRLVRNRNNLHIQKISEIEDSNSTYWIDENLDSNFPYLSFIELLNQPTSLLTDKNTALMDFHKLDFPLIIRKWKKGDVFYPLGMKGKQLVSDFFTNQKFTKIQKEKCYILESNNQIVWIIGHRLDNRFKVNSSSKSILKISVNNGNYKES